jgi:hypothetical protein
VLGAVEGDHRVNRFMAGAVGPPTAPGLLHADAADVGGNLRIAFALLRNQTFGLGWAIGAPWRSACRPTLVR